MSSPSENPMGVGWFGMVIGLGFVLSFGYWCTDFLVVQRAMAADSMSAARRTPLIAAVPKMLFPALVILPGMIAIAINHATAASSCPWRRRDAELQHDHPGDAGAGTSPPGCWASASRRSWPPSCREWRAT
jgi:SSS family solute:Na+ symporter